MPLFNSNYYLFIFYLDIFRYIFERILLSAAFDVNAEFLILKADKYLPILLHSGLSWEWRLNQAKPGTPMISVLV